MKRISFDEKYSYEQAREVSEVIKTGGMVIYPTETCYGLGVDIENEEAVEKIWEFKGDRGNKPVLAIMSSLEMVNKYVVLNKLENIIAHKYWPGPVTLVALSKGLVSKKAQANKDTLGVRVSALTFARDVSRILDKPITSTSANLSGGENPYSIKQVIEGLPQNKLDMIDLVVDAGVLPIKPPSTIVRVVNGNLEVIRQGGVVVSI